MSWTVLNQIEEFINREPPLVENLNDTFRDQVLMFGMRLVRNLFGYGRVRSVNIVPASSSMLATRKVSGRVRDTRLHNAFCE